MRTAWDPATDDGLEPIESTDGCPRCSRSDDREHLMQTTGVAFYRCGACGHMFIVRTAPRPADPEA